MGGGQGGSTKLSGTFKGDMHEVPAYPLHEERGRLGVEARSRVMTPSGSQVKPRPGSREGDGKVKVRGRRGKVRVEGWEVMPGQSASHDEGSRSDGGVGRSSFKALSRGPLRVVMLALSPASLAGAGGSCYGLAPRDAVEWFARGYF